MREIERQIIDKLVNSILDADFAIRVWDGEETALDDSIDYDAIMNAVAATDMTMLYVVGSNRKELGWIMLVHGNDEDVISDYSDNDTVAGLLSDANELANKFRC